MCADLQAMLRGLMSRFIKEDVLEECTTTQRLVHIVQVAMKKSDNHVSLNRVELGFQTDRLLFKVKSRSCVSLFVSLLNV